MSFATAKSETLGKRTPALSFDALGTQCRVFSAIFWNEVSSLRGATGFGFFAVLLEPVMHISLICFWHWVIKVLPVYGQSKILFLTTGLFPVYIFIHVASHSRMSGRTALRLLPCETRLDLIAAASLVKFIAYMMIGTVLFAGIYIIITPQALPFNPIFVITSALALGILGFGMGLTNAAIESIFPIWHSIFGPLVRMMALFSGVLFVADTFLPAQVRYWLSWNPVLHAVDHFRQGFYSEYPKLLYSWKYLWVWAIGLLIFGMIAERATRKYND